MEGSEGIQAEIKRQIAEADCYVGKRYVHTNGNIYYVACLTNIDGEISRLEDHPIDVVYFGVNGKIWSRRLSDWKRSFTRLDQNGD